MATKNQIANRMYGQDFDDLAPAEKAAVTRKFNAGTAPRAAGVLAVTIGRLGNGPTREYIMAPGTTVGDLLSRAGINMDSRESVNRRSNGEAVGSDEVVVNGETYIITTQIKSN